MSHELRFIGRAPAVLPPSLLNAAQRARLDELFAELDGVGRLDARTGRVLIDEGSLRRLLDAHLSGELGAQVMQELEAAPERILTSGDAPGLAPMRWSTLLSRLGPFDPSPDLTYQDLGLGDRAGIDELRGALQRRYPDLPDEAFDAGLVQRLQDTFQGAPGAAAEPRSINAGAFFKCLKRHLGFLAAVAIMFVIGGLVAVFVGAPAAIVALLVAVGFGGAVILVVVGCLANPNLP